VGRALKVNVGSGFNLLAGKKVVRQSDGKIIVGGAFTTYSGSAGNNIVRINESGSVDTTFKVGGGFNNPNVGYPNVYVQDMAVDNAGSIYVVGRGLTAYSGSSLTNSNLIKLTPSGSIDTTFTNYGFSSGSYLNAIELTNDIPQKIIVGGNFTTYSGSTYNYIVKLNSDGTIAN
jgi:uncharacterized delta-60 repeat protein